MTVTTRRVLITGSRKWEDQFLIHQTLLAFHWMLSGDNEITLVSGACPTGADVLCEYSAHLLGWKVERHPADWETHGKSAGFKRNAKMVALGADLCLAFILDGSKGATMTAELAEAAGIYTQIYRRWTGGLPPRLAIEARIPQQSDPDILRGVEAVERSAGVPEEAGDHGGGSAASPAGVRPGSVGES